MNHRQKIDGLLRNQSGAGETHPYSPVYGYAESMSAIENCVAVVSDLKNGTSRIFSGRFAERLGLTDYSHEDSIWEKAILDKMPAEERDEKFLGELRFFNFLRHLPKEKRQHYYLEARLRFCGKRGVPVDVRHRMYYWYAPDMETILYGICIYGPADGSTSPGCVAVDSISGERVLLSGPMDSNILTRRERQVLEMIDRGLTSQAIAAELCISKNTVSRHRQEILAKLQARNSVEACCVARQLKILS